MVERIVCSLWSDASGHFCPGNAGHVGYVSEKSSDTRSYDGGTNGNSCVKGADTTVPCSAAATATCPKCCRKRRRAAANSNTILFGTRKRGRGVYSLNDSPGSEFSTVIFPFIYACLDILNSFMGKSCFLAEKLFIYFKIFHHLKNEKISEC